MACSKYEYVKQYEQEERIIPNCWFVVRVDGRGFTELTKVHDFAKPNDREALNLMTKCAADIVSQFGDICFAYGQSDEYSFLFRRKTALWNRRREKIVTNVASQFASAYAFHWASFMKNSLKTPVAFDGRVVCYPTDSDVRDYFSWRQVDCHINNQYNTCFWSLVKSGVNRTAACEQLKGTNSGDKNEMLFSLFGINYNDEAQIFRKGTAIFRKEPRPAVTRQEAILQKGQKQQEENSDVKLPSGQTQTEEPRPSWLPKKLNLYYGDIIGDEFWNTHPHILGVETHSKLLSVDL